MGWGGLGYGMVGALQAAGIAAVVGFILFSLAHLLRNAFGWRQGTEIGVAFALALLLAAGVDAWELFSLNIVRLESPFAIQQRLARIHDPGSLGLRVVMEFLGAAVGVAVGWLAWSRRA